MNTLTHTIWNTKVNIQHLKYTTQTAIFRSVGTWYYSFKNPETDKLERQTPIYAGENRFKNLKERKNAIKILAKAVENILENGFNPYDEDSVPVDEVKNYSIADAVTFSLELKKNRLKENSFRDFRIRIKSFENDFYPTV